VPRKQAGGLARDGSVGDEGGVAMTVTELDEVGPIDYVVVEFPAGRQQFTGEMAEELARLHSDGTIRVLDVLVLAKNEDGTVEGHELDDLEELTPLEDIELQIAEILAVEDVGYLAEAMEPGSVAGVVVWENRWATPFAAAARRSGGQLVATGRIPTQAIIAAFDADEEADELEDDSQLEGD
jgi:hypothetical protein